MRQAALLAPLLLLSACASVQNQGPPLPTVKYATAGSYMDARTAFTAPPSPEIFDLAVRNWTEAIADSAGCRLPRSEVTSASLVAALELAAMAGFAKQEGANISEMGRYAADMALAAGAENRRPSRARCDRLYRWLPEVNRQGGDAVRRATINSLRRGLFGSPQRP
ncbi:MAG: hypothetical protein KY446_06815 [Proteobacteria bacterium]|nr:hypothetical protein [Pseudomonadota bacterium]MBW3617456.1 hypothetical protein [Pseudomonadota bacterium]